MTVNFVLVGIGGALGSLARHGVGVAIVRLSPSRLVPYATMAVNLLGCLAIGLLAGLLPMSPALRAFVFVGLLGGFTTFSSFGFDTFTLAHGGRMGAAALNLLIQVGVGCLLVAAGYAAGARVQ